MFCRGKFGSVDVGPKPVPAPTAVDDVKFEIWKVANPGKLGFGTTVGKPGKTVGPCVVVAVRLNENRKVFNKFDEKTWFSASVANWAHVAWVWVNGS